MDTVPWYTLPCYGETLANRVVSNLSHVGKKHREPDQKKSDSAKKTEKRRILQDPKCESLKLGEAKKNSAS